MSNSLTDIRRAERYVTGKMAEEDSLVFEARMLVDPTLRANVHFLQKTFALLKLYNRRKLKQEAEAIHQRLFNDPHKQDYRDHIFQLFKR